MASVAPDITAATSLSHEPSSNVTGKKFTDSCYSYDEGKLAELRSNAPWTRDAKFLESVAVSPSAIIKIMMHCQSGVNKGIKKGGNPIEVMGMLLGRPDPDNPKTLTITDAFPLPIEGFETRVIADDANVVNHMIALGECLEKTRKEKFMGWYHSHPFDLGQNSHCFLSQTDLSTQLQWQRAEDPHGNPFVALVVDPLRSLNKISPEIKAFRAFPPEYNSPVEQQCPDGSVETSEQKRLELWGSCWNRYYELKVEYYMSSHARHVLEQLTQDYLWIRTFSGTSSYSNTPSEELSIKLKKATVPLANTGIGMTSIGFRPVRASTQKAASSNSDALIEINETVQRVIDLAASQLYSSAQEDMKKKIFSNSDIELENLH